MFLSAIAAAVSIAVDEARPIFCGISPQKVKLRPFTEYPRLVKR
jgi:hypothetical protein